MTYIKKLVGEKCYLSPVSEDYTDLVVKWSNDLEVSLHTGDVGDLITKEKQKLYLKNMIDRGHAFMIVDNQTNQGIGIARLMGVDMIHNKSYLGIFIGEKDHWSKGIGTEATELILDFGFNIINLKNIMLEVFSFNERAINAYKRCGFKEIGRRRQSITYGNHVFDEVFMDILAEEFQGSHLESFIQKL